MKKEKISTEQFRDFCKKSHLGNMSVIDTYIRSLSQYTPQMHIPQMYQNPTIIEERQMNVASMDVFSRLMMERIIWVGDQVRDEMANIIGAQLLFLESIDNTSDIKMYINSPGGSVTAGLGIIDTMELIEPDVSTVNYALAASMGAMILMSGTKGKRYTLPSARTMIHQPLSGVEGQASDIQITAREIEKTKEELYNRIVTCSYGKKTYEQVLHDADRDYWMRGSEAVDYGIVDHVLTKEQRK